VIETGVSSECSPGFCNYSQDTMRTLCIALCVSIALCQDGSFRRGARRKVIRRKPTSFQDAVPAVPDQPVSRGRALPPAPAPAPPPPPPPAPVSLPPPPPTFQPQPTGQLILDVECPELEGLQVYPNEDSCHQFYKCANGTLTLETCGNGLLFNEATSLRGSAANHCSYNWQTECGNRPRDDTPISSPGCEYQFGIFPSGKGCFASYTKCANGVPSEVYCQLGLAYDHRIHTCNWPDLLVEYAGCDPSAALGDFRCPSNDELSPLARRFFPFPRFPVPKDPQLYIICVDGVPRLNTCAEGSIFDKNTLGCVEQL